MSPKPWEQIPGEPLRAFAWFRAWLLCGHSFERLAADHGVPVGDVRDLAQRYAWSVRRAHYDLHRSAVAAAHIEAQESILADARVRTSRAAAHAAEVLSRGLEAWAGRAQTAPGAEEPAALVALLRAVPQALRRLEKPAAQSAQADSGIDPALLSTEEQIELARLLSKATPQN